MSKKNNIIIIGAGGHCRPMLDIASQNYTSKIKIYDIGKSFIKKELILGYPVVDYFKNIKLKNFKDYTAFLAIGDNKIRCEKMNWLIKYKVSFVNLIHPQSTISKFSSLGVGICVMAHAVINPGTFIGDGVIINTSASIDHDCILEDYAHISPNCSLSGNVKIGKFTHLGTGTSVHPGIVIGNNVCTGVGSKIYKDILDKEVIKNN